MCNKTKIILSAIGVENSWSNNNKTISEIPAKILYCNWEDVILFLNDSIASWNVFVLQLLLRKKKSFLVKYLLKFQPISTQ